MEMSAIYATVELWRHSSKIYLCIEFRHSYDKLLEYLILYVVTDIFY